MRKIGFVIIVMSLASCKKDQAIDLETNRDILVSIEDSAKSQTETTTSKPLPSAIHLDTFGFPSQISQCSCYFATNKDMFLKGRFIYVDDYGNNAYLKINGDLVEIKMEEGDFDPENFDRVIENKEYRVSMKGTNIKGEQESMMYEGQMTVENKRTKEKTITSIYGECGC